MNDLIKLFNVQEDPDFPEINAFNQMADELASDSRVKVLSGGKSLKGKDLVAFVIGTGSKVIGVTSGAHADEPIGVLTQAYFLKGILQKNSYFENLLQEYTFLCHPLVDPDGYELNSTWFSNPLNFKNYWLNNYRNNKPSEDCEHGVPFQEGQTARPEMVFVKNNLDSFAPRCEYYITLHSSHILPGACFVCDQDQSDIQIRQTIVDLCQSYQLPLMDYKVQGDSTMTYLGPGFIGSPTVKSMLEHYKNQPEIMKQIKMTTYEYAQTYCGAKSAFISELPIWIANGMDDYMDSTMTMNEFKKISLENSKQYLNGLIEMEKEISPLYPSMDNPWYSSLKMAIQRGSMALQDEESRLGTYEGCAQMLEVKELENAVNENNCKVLKYAIKSIESLPEAKQEVEKYRKAFDLEFTKYEKQANLTQLSIKTQVEIQLGLIFSGISNFKDLR